MFFKANKQYLTNHKLLQGLYAVIKSHKSDNQLKFQFYGHKNGSFSSKAIKSHNFSGFPRFTVKNIAVSVFFLHINHNSNCLSAQ